jgi:hypothetical protein
VAVSCERGDEPSGSGTTEFTIQGVSKIHGINSGMSSSHVDNQNSLYQHRFENA